MLIDLLSSTNQISFNIIVAKTFGLHTAIYLSELMSILEKAIRKEKVEYIDNCQYFTVSRKYITDRITLTAKEQKEIDSKLAEVNIIKIKPDSSDTLFLNIDMLATMLGTDINKDIVNDIAQIAKKLTPEEKKQKKLEGQRKFAREAIQTTNEELRAAYFDWIDSVLNRYSTINKATVTNNEKLVDAFTQHNLDIALEIVNKTATTGYNTMQYAIDDYKSKHPSYNKMPEQVISKVVKLGKEVF